MSIIYHDGNRQLQDQFGTRRMADRMEERIVRATLDDNDRAFIARLDMFFLATADEYGLSNCSYKGGAPGSSTLTKGFAMSTAMVKGEATTKGKGLTFQQKVQTTTWVPCDEEPKDGDLHGVFKTAWGLFSGWLPCGDALSVAWPPSPAWVPIRPVCSCCSESSPRARCMETPERRRS